MNTCHKLHCLSAAEALPPFASPPLLAHLPLLGPCKDADVGLVAFLVRRESPPSFRAASFVGCLRPAPPSHSSSSKLIFYCSHRSSQNEFGAYFGLAAIVKKENVSVTLHTRITIIYLWHNRKESSRFCDRTSTWPSYEFRKGLLMKKNIAHHTLLSLSFLGVLSNRKIKYCRWEFNWNNKSRKNCHEQVNKRDKVRNKVCTIHSQQSVQIPSLCTSVLRGTRWTVVAYFYLWNASKQGETPVSVPHHRTTKVEFPPLPYRISQW
jgi:hypothetical protein